MIRLGIIGLGTRMARMLSCFQEVAADLHLVGIVDPAPDEALRRLPEAQRSKVPVFATIEELLTQARPDALAIGTRCDLHASIAIQAAAAGLPLFLEKPVATSMAQARALEQGFAEVAVEVVVSFPLRVSKLFGMAKTSLEAGAVGRPEHILSVNYVPYGDVYFNSWYRDHQTTQGLFLQKATHDFDYMAHLMGAPITRIAAMSQQGRVYRDRSLEPAGGDDSRHYHEGIGTPESGMNEDACSALLEFGNGAQGLYTQVFYTRHAGAARGATVSGVRGTLQFDWYKNTLNLHHHRAEETTTHYPPAGMDHFGGDHGLARNFIAVVRGEAKSASPLAAGLQSVYACLAAKESAATGHFVEVRQLTELIPAMAEALPEKQPQPALA